ncbi:uL30 family ribosomal protein [Candidatus Woesearchaeota archaeon]|nr:uL30 family ribosomal protein [Candidatus Woesearchaeota archaeon]
MNKENKGRLAVIRVRGIIGVKKTINDTMNLLNLYKKNVCVVVPDNEIYRGMIQKADGYITWGEIDDEMFNLLVEKRGEEYKGREKDKKGKVEYSKFVKVGDKKIKRFFRLNMPRKGFGRKGIKIAFSKRGALGYRGDKINDLIGRMV